MNFVPVKVDWYTSTFIFYLAVILGCYTLTFIKLKSALVINKKRIAMNNILLMLAFALLLAVKGFGTAGRDLRGGYYWLFQHAQSWESYKNYDSTVEIGFRALTVFLHQISDRYELFIFICALLTIYPVYRIVREYSDRIDIPSALLLFTTCYFISGMSLIRIYLAASIALFAYDAMNKGRSLVALIWIIVASSIHISALILIIPFFFSMARMLDRRLIAFILLAILAILFFGRGSIAAMFFTGERYNHYTVTDNIRFGLAPVVYHVPLFILFYLGRRLDGDRQFARVAFSYLATSFFVGMLGYIVVIFGRMDVYFLPIIIIVPFYLKLLKTRYPRSKGLLNLLVLIYCIARFVIYITGMYNSADVMPYTNIFGWII